MKKIAMIAMLFGFVGAVYAAPQEATSQGGIQYQASVEQESPMMTAGSQLSQCKWQCDEYEDGSQSCYDTCEKFHGGQASIDTEQPTMLAYDDSQQSDPWSGEGGAMLKPQLDTDPLCDTDPWSCFNYANNDATVVRTPEQTAFLFAVFVYGAVCAITNGGTGCN
ncbi:hypothetical protein [Thioalkalivibrio sp. HK1]|uniref:hypothetical protein n=1 Tax=Thioalkalivibrio sp. HK1 TaxID=1469245 RepID=UPI0012DE3FD0|nr:hypothetical protein [Thioalkalivibrio sp. HK1]